MSTAEIDLERWERAEARTADVWPELRAAILANGGLSCGPYSRDRIPPPVYRVNGAAPDDVASILGNDEADRLSWSAGISWSRQDGADAMLEALWRAYEAHQKALEPVARPVKPEPLPAGKRRLSDHLARLRAKRGAALDLALVESAPADIVDAYEAGSRLPLWVGDRERLVTIGCTSGKRPEFCYLLSLPVVEVQ